MFLQQFFPVFSLSCLVGRLGGSVTARRVPDSDSHGYRGGGGMEGTLEVWKFSDGNEIPL